MGGGRMKRCGLGGGGANTWFGSEMVIEWHGERRLKQRPCILHKKQNLWSRRSEESWKAPLAAASCARMELMCYQPLSPSSEEGDGSPSFMCSVGVGHGTANLLENHSRASL
jgi:hypothetical protein